MQALDNIQTRRLPEGLSLRRQEDSIIIIRQWRKIFSPFLAVAAALFGFALDLVFLSIALLLIANYAKNFNSILDFSLLSVAIIALVYWRVSQMLGKTQFTFIDSAMEISHGPVFWKKRSRVDLTEIKELYVRESHYTGILPGRGAGREVFSICGYKDSDGREMKIFESDPVGLPSGIARQQIEAVISLASMFYNIPVQGKE